MPWYSFLDQTPAGALQSDVQLSAKGLVVPVPSVRGGAAIWASSPGSR